MIKLSLDEHLQAKQEGWKILGGYVAKAYNADGNCPFLYIAEIVQFLAKRSIDSELHRKVYMSLPWGAADDSLARKEGWCVWQGSQICSIARHIFETHEDAQAHVQAGIGRNEPLYLKAIGAVAKNKLIHGVA